MEPITIKDNDGNVVWTNEIGHAKVDSVEIKSNGRVIFKNPIKEIQFSSNTDVFYTQVDALFKYIESNDPLQTEKIDKDLVDVKDYYGYNSLHCAVLYENVDVVKYLLGECQPDINNRNNHDESPLHTAIKLGNLEIVKLLVKENCYLYFLDDHDRTPLDLITPGSDISTYMTSVTKVNNTFNVNGLSGVDPHL